MPNIMLGVSFKIHELPTAILSQKKKREETQRHIHHQGAVQIIMRKAKKERKLSSSVVRFSPYAAAPVDYLLLKREPIYFPTRMDHLWHLAMEHQTFHPAVPDINTPRKGAGGRCCHRWRFDRLSRLTQSCYILMCIDLCCTGLI